MTPAPLPPAFAAMRADLGVDITVPFELEIDGERLRFDALIRNFGARNGMVIDRDSKVISEHGARLIELGYGYSCFDFESWIASPYDRQSTIETLSDWGWSGPASERPEWVLDIEEEEAE